MLFQVGGQGTRPTFFEMAAAQQLPASLRAALTYSIGVCNCLPLPFFLYLHPYTFESLIWLWPYNTSFLQVLALRRPFLHRVLDYEDEFFALLMLVLESHSLRTTGSSYSYSFYSCVYFLTSHDWSRCYKVDVYKVISDQIWVLFILFYFFYKWYKLLSLCPFTILLFLACSWFADFLLRCAFWILQVNKKQRKNEISIVIVSILETTLANSNYISDLVSNFL